MELLAFFPGIFYANYQISHSQNFISLDQLNATYLNSPQENKKKKKNRKWFKKTFHHFHQIENLFLFFSLAVIYAKKGK